MTEQDTRRRMFVPDHYRAPDPRALVARYPFAQLVSAARDGSPFATSVPIYFASDAPDETMLVGHLARANPHADVLDEGQAALAIFAGPHAYISSSWYVERPTVPTWNYMTAQVRGRLTPVDDDEEQLAIMRRTIVMSEAYNGSDWTMADAPEGKVEFLLPMIRSFRIEVERIDGVTKLSQTHPPGDRQRVIAALRARGAPEDIQIADRMGELDRG
ncbi:MAG: FMN-binding negative transcriptional regulator [Alphaproteobacteria bacterium]|nr:FMN-binding negative transcriptional regulator [Alphaproteobacteria bacterium]MBU0864310.1 FMN-binding negative transcriptional regulator [Alphaproteobacteria bacterium]MBU1825037.1 FMN-binding negative transcriptional regulator [Alphaproteobacteria bacterium]